MSKINRCPTVLWALVVVLCGACHAVHAQDRPIKLDVDATPVQRQILHVHLQIPAKPGPMTLVYPKWIPGEHGPSGPIDNVVDLHISAGGKPITWQRDLEEMYAINVVVPDASDALDVSLDYANPSATQVLLRLPWNEVLFYPKGGKSAEVRCTASIKLPAGWKCATALPRKPGGATGDLVHFDTVSIETLVDSPLIAGEHFKSIDLSPGSDVQHSLQLVADTDDALDIKPDDQTRFSNLVTEAEALFGAHYYRSYQFLLTLSDQVGGGGLEHHESSDNRESEKYLTDEAMRRSGSDLLPHEMVHSWNGKYRRPADLATPEFQTPMKTDLLWVYEGLTQYLGMVLAARSGLSSPEQFRDSLALNAAFFEHRTGRDWRPLGDTAAAAQLLYRAPRENSARRRGTDFYGESALIWLEADVIIRQKTDGRKSLDDFCRKFHGPPSGPPKVVPYTLDDVVAAMNATCEYDWKCFFQTRVYDINPHAPLGGIEGGGWKLTYSDTPNALQKDQQTARKGHDLTYSIGVSINDSDTLRDIRPESPADKAGALPGMKLVAVNGRKYSFDVLSKSLKAARSDPAVPIELLVEKDDAYKTIRIDYHDGEKFPHLERDESKPDLVDEISKPLKSTPPPATTRHAE